MLPVGLKSPEVNISFLWGTALVFIAVFLSFLDVNKIKIHPNYCEIYASD